MKVTGRRPRGEVCSHVEDRLKTLDAEHRLRIQMVARHTFNLHVEPTLKANMLSLYTGNGTYDVRDASGNSILSRALGGSSDLSMTLRLLALDVPGTGVQLGALMPNFNPCK